MRTRGGSILAMLMFVVAPAHADDGVPAADSSENRPLVTRPVDKRAPAARVAPLPGDENTDAQKLNRHDELRMRQLQREYPAGMERDFIRAQ